MKIKNPQEYIYDFALFGRKGGYKPGLERTLYMLEQVGNPHLKFPTIHIGGTNGKGSTAVFVDAVLKAQGYRVGRFTSPHLSYFGERITVDGEPIGLLELQEFVNETAPMIDSVEEKTPWGRPTFFEVTTFLAMYYFAQKRIDIGVIEVGMGGRLDSTNVIKPIVTAITNVGLEHTRFLGDTVEKIATQKAGIIKSGVPIITGAGGGTLEIIKDRALSLGAPFISLVDAYRWDRLAADLYQQQFNLTTPGRFYPELTINLTGMHQVTNAGLAVAIIEHLPDTIPVEEESIYLGLKAAKWPGRLEIYPGSPLIVIDGAHNLPGFAALISFLDERFNGKQVVFVLSFLKDKDISAIVDSIVPQAKAIIFTRSNNFRAADPNDLQKSIDSVNNIPIESIGQISTALARAKVLAGPEGLICLTGSLYAVAEAREILNAKVVPQKA